MNRHITEHELSEQHANAIRDRLGRREFSTKMLVDIYNHIAPRVTTYEQEYLRRIGAGIAQDGIARLGGEMDVPCNHGISAAWEVANKIACACGYIATMQGNKTRLVIAGGDLLGIVTLDWMSVRETQCKAVRLETQTSLYLN